MTPEQNYRLLRLKTGEKLIAECFEKDDKHLILHRPMEIQIMMGMDEEKNVFPAKLILSDWLAFSKGNNVVLPKDHILAFSEPNEMIVDVYDREKLRLDADKYNKRPENESRPNVDGEGETPPSLDPKKAKKRKELILIQIDRATLIKLMKQLGLELPGMPENWEQDDLDEDDSELDESEESANDNVDGHKDIMPDADGDGFHTPWGDRYDGPNPPDN